VAFEYEIRGWVEQRDRATDVLESVHVTVLIEDDELPGERETHRIDVYPVAWAGASSDELRDELIRGEVIERSRDHHGDWSEALRAAPALVSVSLAEVERRCGGRLRHRHRTHRERGTEKPACHRPPEEPPAPPKHPQKKVLPKETA
jgi:hypothetical protein